MVRDIREFKVKIKTNGKKSFVNARAKTKTEARKILQRCQVEILEIKEVEKELPKLYQDVKVGWDGHKKIATPTQTKQKWARDHYQKKKNAERMRRLNTAFKAVKKHFTRRESRFLQEYLFERMEDRNFEVTTVCYDIAVQEYRFKLEECKSAMKKIVKFGILDRNYSGSVAVTLGENV